MVPLTAEAVGFPAGGFAKIYKIPIPGDIPGPGIAENVYCQDLHPLELADAVGKAAESLWTRIYKEKAEEQQ